MTKTAKVCGCGKTEFTHKYDPVHYLIKNVDDLRKALERGVHEFAISLNGGVKSCKYITTYKDKRGIEKFSVLNMIDDSRQTFTAKTILDESRTNIPKAMSYNSFFVDEV